MSGACPRNYDIYTTNSSGVFTKCPNPSFSSYYCGRTSFVTCNNEPFNPYSDPQGATCSGHYSTQILPDMQPTRDGKYVYCPVHPNDPDCVIYCKSNTCGTPSVDNGSTGSSVTNNDNTGLNSYCSNASSDPMCNSYLNSETGGYQWNAAGANAPRMDLSSPGGGIVPACPSTGCGWPQVVKLANNLLKFMVSIAVPLAAIAFAYAGWLYLSARGNPSQISRAHNIFLNVAIGLVIVLVAWLVVSEILKAFADPNSYISVLQ